MMSVGRPRTLAAYSFTFNRLAISSIWAGRYRYADARPKDHDRHIVMPTPLDTSMRDLHARPRWFSADSATLTPWG